MKSSPTRQTQLSNSVKKKIGERVVIVLATGFYTGYAPIGPGTAGTLLAVPLVFIVSRLVFWSQGLFIIAFATLAIWVSDRAEKLLGKKDAGQIVIDEIAGFLVTMFCIPWTLTNVAVGFVLFRIMDIAKPFPVRKLEVAFKGGAGVVADDLGAGIYAHLFLRFFCLFFP